RDIVRQALVAANRPRFPLPIPMIILHPVSRAFFRWWWRPPVTHYFVDRFFVPETAAFDSVLRHFQFRPARFGDSIAYLRRSGLRWRIFRWRRPSPTEPPVLTEPPSTPPPSA
ncbi:MAG: hypothetical protein GY803_13500, partial [Chloroflexi bacterium]|nr:hypothetical protein [Chloroflexota bacterium]